MQHGVSLVTLGLSAFKRKLKAADKSRVEVGIFSDHAARTPKDEHDEGLSNVEIGYKHEMGVIREGIPARSFLEMPLRTELPSIIKAEAAALVASFAEDGPKAMLERVGFMGEAAIQEAFDTSGFGTWAPNHPQTIQAKGSSKPLIDTSQLRESISSRVK